MSTLGTVDVHCPACDRTVSIPLTVTYTVVLADRMQFGIEADQAVIDAHMLTHDTHDGEPVAA